MPTKEERREVAARLRELAEDYEKVPVLSIIAACELPAPVDDAFMACGIGRAVYATEICGRLADLIEPEERTCRSGVKTIGQVFPDGFDFDGEYTTVYIFPLSCGHEVRSLTNRIPRFCPFCGAKVMEHA